MSRVIQVPIDELLLKALDDLSSRERRPRAALIREACRRYIAEERDRALDQVYERGYGRVPETPALGAAQAALSAQVLGEERW